MILRGFSRPPFLRSEEPVDAMMRDAVFALLALLALPTVFYGPRVLLMAACTAAACAACEFLFLLFARRELRFPECSCVVTGLVVTMLMPAGAAFWIPALAGAFAILVVKMPFGGLGCNPFQPAAAGVAFVTLLRPAELFSYPDPAGGWLPLSPGGIAYAAAESPAAALRSGVHPSMAPLDMIWGRTPGPLGTTAALVLAACALYLFARRAADWKLTAGFLAASGAYAALFPRVVGSALTSLKYEWLAGSLLFAAVFLVTDPVTAPRTRAGKFASGAIAGVLTMFLREFGRFEQSACFAVLLANLCRPFLDRAAIAWTLRKGARHETGKA